MNEPTPRTKSRGFIINIIAIGIVLAVVFFSQQPAVKPAMRSWYELAGAQTEAYWSQVNGWFSASISPIISQEAAKRGAEAKTQIAQQKNNAVQSAWEAFKNYFAEKFSRAFGTEVK